MKKLLGVILAVAMLAACVLGVPSLVYADAAPMSDGQTATIAIGALYSMAIKADGSLWAWGNNEYRQLGDGTAEDRLSPVKIMDGVRSVAAGDGHSMVIKADGSLWAWGSNFYGQHGDGATKKRLSPVKIMDDVGSIATGFSHSLAIKTDGSFWITDYVSAAKCPQKKICNVTGGCANHPPQINRFFYELSDHMPYLYEQIVILHSVLIPTEQMA